MRKMTPSEVARAKQESNQCSCSRPEITLVIQLCVAVAGAALGHLLYVALYG